ncbi:MAG: hypothetical protein HOW73_13325 [Polyangiaceae bacterium]|nr:hypothetical protein [Polyangiaceae bacterium]
MGSLKQLAIAGAGMGGVTLAKRSDIEASCDLDAKTCNSAEGIDAIESARATGLASTIGFAAAGVLLATGIVVFFTAPSDDEAEESAAARLHLGFRAGARGVRAQSDSHVLNYLDLLTK